MKKKEEQWIKEKEMLEEVAAGWECDVEMERDAEDQLLQVARYAQLRLQNTGQAEY